MIENLVSETSTSTGTGDFTLAPQLRSFSSAFGVGDSNPFYYGIFNDDGSEYEIAISYMSDGTTLVRNGTQTIIESSNDGSPVNFSAGVKRVVNDIPASITVAQGAKADTALQPTATANADEFFSSTDMNDYTTAGLYILRDTTVTNTPAAPSRTGLLEVTVRNTGGHIVQTFNHTGTGSPTNSQWRRTYAGSAWTAWIEIGSDNGLSVGAGKSITGAGTVSGGWSISNSQASGGMNLLALSPGGTNAFVDVNGVPATTSDTAAMRLFRGSTVGEARLDVHVGDNSATLVARLGSAGIFFPNIATTASAANARLESSNSPGNQLLRSTSSLTYKRDVEDLDSWRADAFIQNARPVWYRSNSQADNQDWGWYGLIAEEVAAIEPRLVDWAYRDEHYEDVVVPVDDTTDPDEVAIAADQYEEVDGEQRLIEGAVGIKRQLKEGAEKVPDGVHYERLTVMLLDVVRRQGERLAALEASINQGE